MNIDIIEIVRTCIIFEEETLWMSNQHGAQEAWDSCPYGDWMLWMLSLTAGNGDAEVHRNIVMAACDCARMAVGLVNISPVIVDALSEVEMWADNVSYYIPYADPDYPSYCQEKITDHEKARDWVVRQLAERGYYGFRFKEYGKRKEE